jgi:uncharacterized LabA/DUF88 family protein
MRANVYIDGFNLYYGALKGTSYKWLDLEALSRRLLPRYEINRIRYFTARISPRPDDVLARRRQHAYLRALAMNRLIAIHYGRFQESRVRMPLADPVPGSPRTVEVIKTEEKRTDVNIASHLLLDAFRAECDVAVLVSNDADLVEPLRILMAELGMSIGIVNPFPRPCRELAALNPAFYRPIRGPSSEREILVGYH